MLPSKKLHDGRRPNVLDAVGVLRPAYGVGEAGSFLPPRVLADRLADLQEKLLAYAGNVLDHLRGVAGVVLFQELEHAAGMLERRVHLGRVAALQAASLGVVGLLAGGPALLPLAGGARRLHTRVLPGRGVVGAGFRVPAGEHAVQIFGVLEILVYYYRGVRVVDDVLLEVAVVL